MQRGAWVFVDTRKLGAMSEMLDGCFHIVPQGGPDMHHVDLGCWCNPRVVWSPEAGTCIVSHRRVAPTVTHGS
jgi:hypothetical protein